MLTTSPPHVIPRTVWVLGFVSLGMDLSSEMVHSLPPVFLVSTLGAGVLTVGVIEGLAEATALLVKIFSGAISDAIGRRKALLLLGYGVAALTKPLFPLATSAETVFTARFMDRERHPGGPAGRPGRRRGAAGDPRRVLRPAPVDRNGRRVLRPGAGDPANGLTRRRHRRRAMGRGRARMAGGDTDRPGHRRAGPYRRRPSLPLADSLGGLWRFSGAYWWVVGVGAVFSRCPSPQQIARAIVRPST
jgi:hypothetical protein